MGSPIRPLQPEANGERRKGPTKVGPAAHQRLGVLAATKIKGGNLGTGARTRMDSMEENSNLPRTPPWLRSWLKETEQGRALLGAVTNEAIEEAQKEKCRACENIRPYPKVLVVLRRLGRFPGAQVYAEEGVTIRFLELPDVTYEGKIGILAEELIELRLPRNWRHLVGLDAKRITSQVFRGVSLEECLRHTVRAVALGEIRMISKQEGVK